ncbi:DUF2946 family protein [Bradyrhizobium sp. RDM4]|uniref:DUF2946 family protein n=1 Tax=Bradyrhizobium sp. RDM4 TaxID=3378765 RepID=UPI0038FCB3B1
MLLSILVQSFAPIAAFRAVADAVNDPLYMGSICSEAMSSPTDSRTVPTQQSQGCCVFCAAGHSVAAIAGDPPPSFSWFCSVNTSGYPGWKPQRRHRQHGSARTLKLAPHRS